MLVRVDDFEGLAVSLSGIALGPYKRVDLGPIAGMCVDAAIRIHAQCAREGRVHGAVMVGLYPPLRLSAINPKMSVPRVIVKI